MSTSSSRKGSTSQSQDDKIFVIDPTTVDEAGLVVSSTDEDDVDPEVADKLRRKIDRHILPLMMREF